MNSALLAAFVEFMNTTDANGQSRWDLLAKKQAHDAEMKPIEGKFFLSSGKLSEQNVGIKYAGGDAVTTRLELTILARNIQNADSIAAKKASAAAKRAATSVKKLDPVQDKATLEQMFLDISSKLGV